MIEHKEVSWMLAQERKTKILQLLKAHGIVRNKELIGVLEASESSVRRDLQELEDEGKLIRIHGGAEPALPLDYEMSMDEKSVKNVHQKKQIARQAVDLIGRDDVVFLDAGTTTLEMIHYLSLKPVHCKVVTNSAHHALELRNAHIPTIIIGGRIKASTDAVVGATAIEQLSRYSFTKAFLGMNGVGVARGYTTPDSEEAAVKRLVIDNAKDVYVLADSSKINQVSFTKVADLGQATIITDQLDRDVRSRLAAETKVIEVGD
jgi:DeoR family fructose operon transcriptional repressor